MERKVQSRWARTLKMSGSPVSTASWPTSSPGWVTNRHDSSSRSIMRWYTCSKPEITNCTLTSCRPHTRTYKHTQTNNTNFTIAALEKSIEVDTGSTVSEHKLCDQVAERLYLVSLTCHHRAGFHLVQRHSTLQQTGVLNTHYCQIICFMILKDSLVNYKKKCMMVFLEIFLYFVTLDQSCNVES